MATAAAEPAPGDDVAITPFEPDPVQVGVAVLYYDCMRLALHTGLTTLAILGLSHMPAQAQRDWLDKIAGEYIGHLVDDAGEKPVLTILRRTAGSPSDNGALSGEYTFGVERDAGKLEACSPVRTRVLRCTWIDRFGQGPLELEFEENLTSFKGRWSADGLPGVWFPWNGRARPVT